MKKVAIITIQGYYNYGNRWQNYAVQELLEKYDCNVDTIIAKRSGRLFALKSVIKLLCGKKSGKRFFKMRRFSKTKLKERRLIYKDYQIPTNIVSEYDYFVTGSDQVWHPRLARTERQYFFLEFAERKQRICLSPSIGIDHLREEYFEEYKNALNGFENLCCREKNGVDLIHNITGRKAEWLIDPTLALTNEEWHELYQDYKVEEPPYILLAFIGKLGNEEEQKIHKISEEYDLKIIDVFSEMVGLGPEEMLAYIEHATLVITDSFHFTAFSINFNRPFMVMRRKGNEYGSTMFSRLESLLMLFGLQERIDCDVAENELLVCDFDNSNAILERERTKLYQYLEMCFGV